MDPASYARLVASRPRALFAATGEKQHGKGNGAYSTYAHVDETFKRAPRFHERGP